MPTEEFLNKQSYREYIGLRKIRVMSMSFDEVFIDLNCDIDEFIFERKSKKFITEIKIQLLKHTGKLLVIINKIKSDFWNYEICQDLIIDSLIMLYKCVEYILILSKYVISDLKLLVEASFKKIDELKKMTEESRFTDEHRQKLNAELDRYTIRALPFN